MVSARKLCYFFSANWLICSPPKNPFPTTIYYSTPLQWALYISSKNFSHSAYMRKVKSWRKLTSKALKVVNSFDTILHSYSAIVLFFISMLKYEISTHSYSLPASCKTCTEKGTFSRADKNMYRRRDVFPRRQKHVQKKGLSAATNRKVTKI
jgi:hypothetical protein